MNTEGTTHDWHEPTITTEEIAGIGGWDPGNGVVIVDVQNNERTLKPGEVVELKPGIAFCKKVRFKRGQEWGRKQ